ncbi:zinc finger protein 32-like, partial [Anabrus simplex]|uniref:zinc finger protein 32-like n=1 Tax=Anabrus simplex TaxID=316456 RepID=UPI0035A2A67C
QNYLDNQLCGKRHGKEEADFINFMQDPQKAGPPPEVVDSWADLEGAEHVTRLTDATFDAVLKTGQSILVMFYTHWTLRQKLVPWWNKEIAAAIKERRRAHKPYGRQPTVANMVTFKILRVKAYPQDTSCNSYRGKRFECQMCHRTFAHRGTLDGHILTHTGQRKFQCTLCSKEFVRRSHVKAHLLTHSGEKAFHCNICGKDFGRRGNLKVHMETHTGGRRFKCEVCNKEFTQQGSLKAHMLIHSGEKNYRCTICYKEFIQQSTLTKHMLTHTGERRFTCSLCPKAFTQKGTLNRHLMLHARMDSGSLDDVEFNELTSNSNKDTLSTDIQPTSPEELSNEWKPVTLDETMSNE